MWVARKHPLRRSKTHRQHVLRGGVFSHEVLHPRVKKRNNPGSARRVRDHLADAPLEQPQLRRPRRCPAPDRARLFRQASKSRGRHAAGKVAISTSRRRVGVGDVLF